MDQDWKSWDWARIGAYLEAARGARSRPEVAAALGIHPDSIANVENGRVASRRKPATAVALAGFYGWTPDSLRIVGTGGEPVVAATTPQEEPVGSPLSPEERDAAIAIIRASPVLSEDTKQRVITDILSRSNTGGNSNDAAG